MQSLIGLGMQLVQDGSKCATVLAANKKDYRKMPFSLILIIFLQSSVTKSVMESQATF